MGNENEDYKPDSRIHQAYGVQVGATVLSISQTGEVKKFVVPPNFSYRSSETSQKESVSTTEQTTSSTPTQD